MADNKKVKFVRIRGKIVPIKVKKQSDSRKLAKAGLAAHVGGAGLLAGGGEFGRRKLQNLQRMKSNFQGHSAILKSLELHRQG